MCNHRLRNIFQRNFSFRESERKCVGKEVDKICKILKPIFIIFPSQPEKVDLFREALYMFHGFTYSTLNLTQYATIQFH